jgi:hypothetical protein
MTLGIALIIFWRFHDWRLILVCFLFGFFIDIDHWFDYLVHYGLDINLIRFFDTASYVKPSGKIYVPLHGWEYVFLFWLVGRWLGKKFKIKGFEWAVSLSYFGHLLLDDFSFSHHPLAYSFIYRLLNNFSLKSFNGI